MRSQPASIVWRVTSTAAFYHCWSYSEIDVLCIFDTNIVSPLGDMQIYFDFWFDKRQWYLQESN